jgi:hypothetical protein
MYTHFSNVYYDIDVTESNVKKMALKGKELLEEICSFNVTTEKRYHLHIDLYSLCRIVRK